MQISLVTPNREIETRVFNKCKELIDTGIPLDNILVLTSGHTAANEIKGKIKEHFPQGYGELWINTGPGFCSKLLSKFPLGINRNLELVTGWKRYVIFQETIRNTSLASQFNFLRNNRSFILHATNLIDMLQANDVRADNFFAWAKNCDNPKFLDLANIYLYYKNLCRKSVCYTPSGLGQLIVKKLEDNSWLIEMLSNKFEHIIFAGVESIDIVYLKITYLLSSSTDKITSFIDIVNYLMSPKNHQENRIQLDYLGITHEEALKSLKECKVGIPGIISRFFHPGEKNNVSDDPSVMLVQTKYAADESYRVVEKIKELINQGITPENCIVFYRKLNNHPNLTELLTKNGIEFNLDTHDYRYQDSHIKFIVDFLSYIQNPSDKRFGQILLSPVIGIEPYTCRCWAREAKQEGKEFKEYINGIVNELPVEVGQHVNNVFKLLKEDSGSTRETVEKICTNFELYKKTILKEDAVCSINRLKEFMKMTRFVDSIRSANGTTFSISDLIELWNQSGLQLTYEEDKEPAGVTVADMRTAENIKGEYIFILGAADGITPAARKPQYYLTQNEIESMLAGVGPLKTEGALTREQAYLQEQNFFIQAIKAGKNKVYISFAKEYPGMPNAVPSTFIYTLLNYDEVTPEIATYWGLNWKNTDKLEVKDIEIPLTKFKRETALKSLACRVLSIDNELEQKKDILAGLPPEEYKPKFFLPLPEKPVKFNGAISLSASAISDYLNCPRKYFFNKILRLEDEGSEHLEFGLLIHKALEFFHTKHPILDSNNDLETDMEQILDDIFSQFNFGQFLVAEGQRRRAREMLLDYLQVEKQQWECQREVVYKEHRFKWKEADFILRGVIDRIDKLSNGEYEVIDYKSGKPHTYKNLRKKFIPSADEEYQPEDLQLPLYYWALKEIMPQLSINFLTLYYLKEGPVPRRFKLVNSETELNEICTQQLNGLIKNKFYEIIEQIKTGYFPARASNNCYFCNFSAFCENQEVVDSE
ncbi:MAG: PD-(D/E)XK nuclease family protein [Clostridiales bacterium]|nr:PD-(D/E)XK nuclease family protein [Clostridiales bacterium]MCF8023284.1 PD-(D/E)XK nuclease family protein [Clostridiales bacterium]